MRLADCLAPYVAFDLFDSVVLVVLASVLLVSIFCDGFAGIFTHVPTRPVVFQLLLAILKTRTNKTAWHVNARPDIKAQSPGMELQPVVLVSKHNAQVWMPTHFDLSR